MEKYVSDITCPATREIMQRWSSSRYDTSTLIHAKTIVAARNSCKNILELAEETGVIKKSMVSELKHGINNKKYEQLTNDPNNKEIFCELFMVGSDKFEYLSSIVNNVRYIRGLQKYTQHIMMDNPDIKQYAKVNTICIIDIDDSPHVICSEMECIKSLQYMYNSDRCDNPIVVWLKTQNLSLNLHLAKSVEITNLINKNAFCDSSVNNKIDLDNPPEAFNPLLEIINKLETQNKTTAVVRVKKIDFESGIVDFENKKIPYRDFMICIRAMLQNMGVPFEEIWQQSKRGNITFAKSGKNLVSELGLIFHSTPIENGIMINLEVIDSDYFESIEVYGSEIDSEFNRLWDNGGIILNLAKSNHTNTNYYKFIGRALKENQKFVWISENFPVMVDDIDPISFFDKDEHMLVDMVLSLVNSGTETIFIGNIETEKHAYLTLMASMYGLRTVASVKSSSKELAIRKIVMMASRFSPSTFFDVDGTLRITQELFSCSCNERELVQ
ncbi:hypothetical protein BOO92_15920 [Vibrio navarrensis]|uniref:hypothetical protein n=1 Tax=Vibrio navarrensis TaxID=29495 RepID=UPI001865B4BF|nr:hypothetical protein [Vibrio navarrensis]MBE3658165.1 hypothetical protein [Vibrio navarrensis]